MCDEVQSLYNILLRGVEADESMAHECAELVQLAEQEGKQGFADVLRFQSRYYIISALERKGKIAALRSRYRNIIDII